MKYCMCCGSAEVRYEVPPTDSRARHQCMDCGYIYYLNPRLVAGSVPVSGARVLLCRRAIEPRRLQWTLPAGYMELGETAAEAALRETWEEATARVELEDLFALFSVPHANQVYLIYRTRLLDGNHAPGDETMETRLFSAAQIPWEDIAFSTVRYTLELFFQDQAQGCFPVHTGDILRVKSNDRLCEDQLRLTSGLRTAYPEDIDPGDGVPPGHPV